MALIEVANISDRTHFFNFLLHYHCFWTTFSVKYFKVYLCSLLTIHNNYDSTSHTFLFPYVLHYYVSQCYSFSSLLCVLSSALVTAFLILFPPPFPYPFSQFFFILSLSSLIFLPPSFSLPLSFTPFLSVTLFLSFTPFLSSLFFFA